MNNAGMNVVDVKWLDGYPNQIAKEILSLKTLFLSEKNQWDVVPFIIQECLRECGQDKDEKEKRVSPYTRKSTEVHYVSIK